MYSPLCFRSSLKFMRPILRSTHHCKAYYLAVHVCILGSWTFGMPPSCIETLVVPGRQNRRMDKRDIQPYSPLRPIDSASLLWFIHLTENVLSLKPLKGTECFVIKKAFYLGIFETSSAPRFRANDVHTTNEKLNFRALLFLRYFRFSYLLSASEAEVMFWTRARCWLG